MSRLLQPVTLGSYTLRNRVAMAPMTRCRAAPGFVPNSLNTLYYKQRASAGLIITEGTNISPLSSAFDHAPGIWTKQQIEGWKPVTAAVTGQGTPIFIQLWHSGRISCKGLLDGSKPLSPSGINDDLEQLHVWGQLDNGHYIKISASSSRALTNPEIKDIAQQYGIAACNSIAAGFSGVEIHAANGYLPHQFLSPTINTRTDEYGGSPANRARFLREIIEQVGVHVPMAHVGVRISPFALYNNPRDVDHEANYGYVAAMLQDLGVGFLHIADTNGWAGSPDMDKILLIIKPHYKGIIIVNGGLTPQQSEGLIQSGQADIASFGRLFLANPDLPRRIERNGPYNQLRDEGHYGGGEEGYTDYPSLDE